VIAVKALRIYQTSDIFRLLKVVFEFCGIHRTQLRQISRSSHPRLSYGGSFLTLMFCLSMVYIIWTRRHRDFA
jgi:hypothetical protein